MAQPSTVKIEAPRTQPMRMPRRWWRRNITFATIVGVLGLIAIVEGIALYQTLSDHESEQQSVARYDASRDTSARETKTAAWDDAIVVGQAGADDGNTLRESRETVEFAFVAQPDGWPVDEIDLGEFAITSYQPASNTTLFISFHLFGTVSRANNDEVLRRLDDCRHRMRDRVIVTVRGADVADLSDAGLGLIKRRILETVNKTLGKPLLQGVVFSKFSCVEH